MSNHGKDDQFKQKLKSLGAKLPICDRTRHSSLVGYDYDGQIYRYRVPAADEDLLDKAKAWALAELEGRVAGIVRSNGKN